MKISLRWLDSYVDVSDFFEKPEELAEKLIHAGLEVEGIENLASSFKNVVVGHVTELGRHPDADRLTLCQVDVGGKMQQIVCGATNHKQGDKVVAALPGAVLPGNFAIKKSKIRGVESLGMLCSEVELGLADESPGIWILPEDAPVGTAFAEYQGLDDIVIELSVTPNRADCLSHLGLAREISCLLDRPVKMPEVDFAVGKEKTSDFITLRVEETEACPRYTGRFIRGVKIQESPSWLKKRVESVGMNSINNVVDVTNFVMMEFGQPLHAFDAKQLSGGVVSVDFANKGEKFITLDGTELDLSGDELMIRDGAKPVALAGVVGGVNSGVTDETTDLFVESAYFMMAQVRKTARKFGIETDSAYRFSRGVDPDSVKMAMDRACKLIVEVAGGEALDAPYDNYPSPVKKEPVDVRLDFVEQKLGYSFAATDFENWVRRLGCEILSKDEQNFQILPPAFRWDLNIKEDFVEEFARLQGYDRIPETMPALVGEPAEHVSEFSLHSWTHNKLQGQGFQQVLNFSFVDATFQADLLGDSSKLTRLGLTCDNEAVSLRNPLSEELGGMRTSMIPWLCRNVAFNDRHGNLSGRIYELGFVFGHEGDEYWQKPRVGMALWGEDPGLWEEPSVPLVFQMKSEVETLLSSLKSRSWKWQNHDRSEVPDFVHPGQFASLFFEGKTVGYIGAMHPKWQEKLKIRHKVALAEFDLESLLRGQPKKTKAKSPSKFPRVERDLAFIMPRSLPAGDVMAEIRKVAGARLVDLLVFDVYEGENVGPDEKSVAFRLQYQGSDETMTDDQILGLQNSVINSLSQKFSIHVR